MFFCIGVRQSILKIEIINALAIIYGFYNHIQRFMSVISFATNYGNSTGLLGFDPWPLFFFVLTITFTNAPGSSDYNKCNGIFDTRLSITVPKTEIRFDSITMSTICFNVYASAKMYNNSLTCSQEWTSSSYVNNL